MVHELPDAQRFFGEIARASKPGARLLLAEPRGHVNDAQFAAELVAAAQFEVTEHPAISCTRAAVMRKK